MSDIDESRLEFSPAERFIVNYHTLFSNILGLLLASPLFITTIYLWKVEKRTDDGNLAIAANCILSFTFFVCFAIASNNIDYRISTLRDYSEILAKLSAKYPELNLIAPQEVELNNHRIEINEVDTSEEKDEKPQELQPLRPILFANHKSQRNSPSKEKNNQDEYKIVSPPRRVER